MITRFPIRRRLFMLLAMLVAAALCGGAVSDDDAIAPWPDEDWPVSSPTEQGLDEQRLMDLTAKIRANTEIHDLHSLLIVRRGWLVVEEYFHGHNAEQLHTQQSVSKSFTSALVGIALEQGHLKSVDEKVLDFFPDPDAFDNVDDRKRKITIDNLLTMRTGTDYHENGTNSPHFQLNRLQRGWTKFILSRPMVEEPGTYFNYDSGAVILFDALLKQRTGQHADAFCAEHLFKPLGITKSRWFTNQEGHPHLGGGLDLRSRDMARFGLLYLRGGRWGDTQVVPEAWVKESLSRKVTFQPQRGRTIGYGNWWWVLPPDPEGAGEANIYGAFGFMAQYIFLVPEHDLVVVFTGGARNGRDQRVPQDLLYTDILPSIDREDDEPGE